MRVTMMAIALKGSLLRYGTVAWYLDAFQCMFLRIEGFPSLSSTSGTPPGEGGGGSAIGAEMRRDGKKAETQNVMKGKKERKKVKETTATRSPSPD
jgi:hypothetical protein